MLRPLFTQMSHLAKNQFGPYGYIYFLRWSEGVVKIGRSINPYNRFLGHQNERERLRVHNQPSVELQVIAILKFANPTLARQVEAHLHNRLSDRRIGEDELYDLPDVAHGEGEAAARFFERFICDEILYGHLRLRQHMPAKGWRITPGGETDALLSAAESQAYFEATCPLPDCPHGNKSKQKQYWQNLKATAPEEYDRRIKRIHDAAAKNTRDGTAAKALRERWKDPEFRAKMAARPKSEYMKRLKHEDPAAFQERVSKMQQGFREHMRDDPTFHKKITGGLKVGSRWRTRPGPNQGRLFE